MLAPPPLSAEGWGRQHQETLSKPTLFNNGRYTQQTVPTDPPHNHYNRHKKQACAHIHTYIVSKHLATRDNNKITCAHLPHALAALKRYFPASLVAPLTHLRTNKSLFLKSYLHKNRRKNHIHYAPFVILTYTIYIHLFKLHPHTHHMSTSGFMDISRRCDCTTGQIEGEAGW